MKYFLIFLTLITMWLVAINSPYFFINKKYSCENFIIHYSNERDLKNLCSALSYVAEKTGMINRDDKLDIYLTNSKRVYYVLSYFGRKNFYVNFINNYILLSPVDFNNPNFLNNGDLNFNEEIAKAIISLKLLKTHQKLDYLGISRWKIDGYAKYRLSEIQEFSERDICEKKSGDKYIGYENMIVTRYIFDDKRYSKSDFFDSNISYDFYLDEVKSKYCR